MNILHMKYAVEVARTGSISRAAEHLFTGQPNVSRAIKDLENSLGITIFNRSPQGIVPTPMGEEFLSYARLIISQLDEMEARYNAEKLTFNISIPRASYISDAFVKFVCNLDQAQQVEINYKETNSLHAVNNIIENGYQLGVIRIQAGFDTYFSKMLEEKGLQHTEIAEFDYQLLIPLTSPLAKQDVIRPEQLSNMIEIAHGDPYVPTMTMVDAKKAELSEQAGSHILVHERSIQFELVREVPNAFMWSSPIPEEMLERHQLAERSGQGMARRYRDILIYRKGYRFTELDDRFIAELHTSRDRTFRKKAK